LRAQARQSGHDGGSAVRGRAQRRVLWLIKPAGAVGRAADFSMISYPRRGDVRVLGPTRRHRRVALRLQYARSVSR
jgi:hypothetical protein